MCDCLYVCVFTCLYEMSVCMCVVVHDLCGCVYERICMCTICVCMFINL